MSETEQVLELVRQERKRQNELKRAGRFKFTPADWGMPEVGKLASIVEELGEVARNVMAANELVTDGNGDNAALREELVQVAALSVAWAESLL